MITWPPLHDITASLNAHGRIVLKIPLDYTLTAVSSEHQLHSWCPWERQNGYTNSRLLWGRETHFPGQDVSYSTLPWSVCPYDYGIIWQLLPPLKPQTCSFKAIKHVHDVVAEYTVYSSTRLFNIRSEDSSIPIRHPMHFASLSWYMGSTFKLDTHWKGFRLINK